FTRYGFSLWEIEVFGSLPVIPEPEPVPEPEPELVLAPGAVNLALNRPPTSSSNESATLTAAMAFDGTANSRGSTSFSDNQWVAVDLGNQFYISAIKLNWQNSYAREYLIQTSADGINWTTVFTETDGNGGNDIIYLNAEGRHVRMLGLTRFTRYGFS